MTLQGYAAEAAWIRSRLNTEWDDRTLVAWDNVASEKPEDGSPWIGVTIRASGSGQASMGTAPTYRHDGLLVVEVFTQAERGEGENLELCDAVAAVFRGARGSGIRFGVPYPVRAGQTKDGWYKRDVLCPFTRDTVFEGS